MPIPADAPALRPAGPPAAADVVSVGVTPLLLVALAPLLGVAVVVVLDDAPVVAEDVPDEADDVEEADDTDEVVVEVDEVDDDELADVVVVTGSVSSPKTCRPKLRSWSSSVNTALFSPSMPSTPVRMLNQHPVLDVKLRSTGTVGVKPGTCCWLTGGRPPCQRVAVSRERLHLLSFPIPGSQKVYNVPMS